MIIWLKFLPLYLYYRYYSSRALLYVCVCVCVCNMWGWSFFYLLQQTSNTLADNIIIIGSSLVAGLSILWLNNNSVVDTVIIYLHWERRVIVTGLIKNSEEWLWEYTICKDVMTLTIILYRIQDCTQCYRVFTSNYVLYYYCYYYYYYYYYYSDLKDARIRY